VRNNPDFWGWPSLFVADREWKGEVDSEGYGKMDRHGVRMRLGGETIEVNWWYNPKKRDFRMRSEKLRSAGNVGDILRIEKSMDGGEFDYYAEIIPKGTSLYPEFLALCAEAVRNSKKRFGYY
jgi:hypothetical protein